MRPELSLKESHPHLAEQFDFVLNAPMDPSEFSAGSNKKVWWCCSKGHSYPATVAHRANGTECPICSNRKVVTGINDLASQRPDLAGDWHRSKNDWSPQEITAGSNKKAWWVCPRGHEWQAQVAKRAKGQGCPTCANRIVLTGFNDLETRYPLAASSWHPNKNHPLLPSDVVFGSATAFWWLCRRGHEWKAAFDKRRIGEGCAICNGVKIEPGFNDLATKSPKALELWDFAKNTNLNPREISSSGSKKYWWLCPKGHSFLAVPRSVVYSSVSGCPVCNGKRAIPGQNDLATTDPSLVESWDFELNQSIRPTSITRGSDRLVAWKCEKSHRWISTVSSRALQGVGCPTCSGNRLLAGFNDLATRHPGLLPEWDFELNQNIQPQEVMPGSHQSAWWICKHNHRWQATIANRARGRGCPICRFSEPGVNDLASAYPELLVEWDFERNAGTDPSAISRASGQKVFWTCEKGHNWRATIANRTVVGTGCPSCALTGYRIGEPGILYFLANRELEARKIGITNAGKTRLAKFEQKGWVVLNILEHRDGQLIYDLEQMILRWIRAELGLGAVLSRKQMGSLGGWTETFSLEGIEDSDVLEKIYLELEKLEAIVDTEELGASS